MRTKDFVERLFTFIAYSIVFIAVIVTLLPLIYVLNASFSDPYYVSRGDILLYPKGFYLESYKTIFAEKEVWQAYYNTILYTFFGTFLNLTFTMLAAYPLTRRKFFARSFFSFFFLFTMFFSGGLIPLYLIVVKLGMYNTRWAMIIPPLISVWNLIICRTYIQTSIPEELIECAKIEGCSEFRILRAIIVPLSKPIIATLIIFYGVNHWNSYFNALVFLRNERLQPLQLYLRKVLMASSPDLLQSYAVRLDEVSTRMQLLFTQIKFSMIIVSILPILLIYPFFQKYFVKGMLIGYHNTIFHICAKISRLRCGNEVKLDSIAGSDLYI
ncbi:MAG: carbohydrate ABC transporter permease [Spirochaetota bacterium]